MINELLILLLVIDLKSLTIVKTLGNAIPTPTYSDMRDNRKEQGDINWHIAGGSSGGSAVSVATSMCVALVDKLAAMDITLD